jgi:hypothetical protein
MTTQNIIKGIIVSFDIFPLDIVKTLHEQITQTFETNLNLEKSVIMGVRPIEIQRSIWNIEIDHHLIETLKTTCDEDRFSYSFDLFETFVKKFQIVGYHDPTFPFYIVMVMIELQQEVVNASTNLNRDLIQVSLPIRLFIESLNGMTNQMSNWSPRASIVTQLWVHVDQEHLANIRKTGVQLHASTLTMDEDVTSFEQQLENQNKLRKLEPFDLSPSAGDIHSHVICAENVIIVLGHLTQLALNGLHTPYILYMSYNEKLLRSESIDPLISSHRIDEIGWKGYAYLISLLAMRIYLYDIHMCRSQIDQELTATRETIDNIPTTIPEVDEYLSKISQLGTRLFALSNKVGVFSRKWEFPLKAAIATRENTMSAIEIPIYNNKFLPYPPSRNGYIKTLATNILHSLHGNQELLSEQEAEITSIRTYLSDIVTLNNIKSNEILQKRMYWITVLSLLVAVISIIVGVFI